MTESRKAKRSRPGAMPGRNRFIAKCLSFLAGTEGRPAPVSPPA